MRKISLLLTLFVFGCHSLTSTLAPTNIATKDDLKTQYLPGETHNQFASRNLENNQKTKNKVQIAILLPFSGKNKDLGWHLFNAAVLSLFENDLNRNVELLPFNSGSSILDVKKAIKEIVKKNIKIIIGPVFSSEIQAISDDIIKNKITAISFSNNQELLDRTNEDGGIFLAGLMPEAQIDKIVTYAMEHGKINFSVIAPNNQYGIIITNLVKKMVNDRDGNFISSEIYSSNSQSINKAVERLIKSFKVPSWAAEGGGNKLSKDFIAKESDRLYPQAIVIPEAGKNLSKIANFIKQNNIEERDFQLIGTSQWDDILTLNDPNLVGAWFPAPENVEFRNFEKNYYQSYNKFPPRISSISYDMILATLKVVEAKKGGIPTIEDFVSYQSENNGFRGIDGPFRFLSNGLLQRNLAVLQVDSGSFETIEKPVDSFLKY